MSVLKIVRRYFKLQTTYLKYAISLNVNEDYACYECLPVTTTMRAEFNNDV